MGIGMGLMIAPLFDIILAGVPPREAGSASGVLNTANQMGGAIGVALIGVIFFGLLGTQALVASSSVTPQIRSGLQTAGLPAQAQDGIVSGFTTCFHDQITSQDPYVLPVSCQQAQSQSGSLPAATAQSIGQTLTAAADQARKLTFIDTMTRSLWYEVAAFLVCALLTLLLPLRAREQTAPVV